MNEYLDAGQADEREGESRAPWIAPKLLRLVAGDASNDVSGQPDSGGTPS